MQKPLIGLTMDFSPGSDTRPIARGQDICYQPIAYLRYLQRDDCVAVQIGTPTDNGSVTDLIERLDGLILTGGDDVDPAAYGETPLSDRWRCDAVRTRFETALVQEALRQQKPIFGICRGHQMLNVALGGTLIQDIPSQVEEALQHRSPNRPLWNHHSVEIAAGTMLYRILGQTSLQVTTSHHQAVRQLGRTLALSAHSSDGMVEAIEKSDQPFVLGVQWHPEGMAEDLSSRLLIAAFLKAARERMANPDIASQTVQDRRE